MIERHDDDDDSACAQHFGRISKNRKNQQKLEESAKQSAKQSAMKNQQKNQQVLQTISKTISKKNQQHVCHAVCKTGPTRYRPARTSTPNHQISRKLQRAVSSSGLCAVFGAPAPTPSSLASSVQRARQPFRFHHGDHGILRLYYSSVVSLKYNSHLKLARDLFTLFVIFSKNLTRWNSPWGAQGLPLCTSISQRNSLHMKQ
jgi:hypothetical protein